MKEPQIIRNEARNMSEKIINNYIIFSVNIAKISIKSPANGVCTDFSDDCFYEQVYLLADLVYIRSDFVDFGGKFSLLRVVNFYNITVNQHLPRIRPKVASARIFIFSSIRFFSFSSTHSFSCIALFLSAILFSFLHFYRVWDFLGCRLGRCFCLRQRCPPDTRTPTSRIFRVGTHRICLLIYKILDFDFWKQNISPILHRKNYIIRKRE